MAPALPRWLCRATSRGVSRRRPYLCLRSVVAPALRVQSGPRRYVRRGVVTDRFYGIREYRLRPHAGYGAVVISSRFRFDNRLKALS